MEEDKCRHGVTINFDYRECYDCAIDDGCTWEQVTQAREESTRKLAELKARRRQEWAEHLARKEQERVERREKAKRDIPKFLILHPLGCGLLAALPFALLAYVGLTVVRHTTFQGMVTYFIFLTKAPFLLGLFAGLVIGFLRLRSALK